MKNLSPLGLALVLAACTPPTEESVPAELPPTAATSATPGGTPPPSGSAAGAGAALPAGTSKPQGAGTAQSEVGPAGTATLDTTTTEGVGAPGGVAADAGPSAPTGCWRTTVDGTSELISDDKIVLFDGTGLQEWRRENAAGEAPAHWALLEDGSMEVVPAEPPTDLQTRQGFEDLCVHVEYLTPEYPSNVAGQQRGNSGIYLKSAYEMQILDSIGRPPAIDSCGAVYSIAPPLAVACNRELVWNTYEIEFKASQWSGTTKTRNASFALVTLNGIVVQREVSLNPNGGFTEAGNADRPGPQPLLLQDHRNRIKFRNIWVRVPRY